MERLKRLTGVDHTMHGCATHKCGLLKSHIDHDVHGTSGRREAMERKFENVSGDIRKMRRIE